ncbi:MAG: hypothetical protein JXR42_04510 [Gammaproteobacteria bacterium]|nr:hypothetical protein [Gammaproteobacteria bacterium]
MSKKKEHVFLDLRGVNDVEQNIKFSRIAGIVAEHCESDLIIMPGFKLKNKKAIFNGRFKLINPWLFMAKAFFRSFFQVVGALLSIGDGKKLYELKLKGMSPGVHIYDTLLKKKGVASIDSFSVKDRCLLAFEIVYFYGIFNFLSNGFFSYLVLPDNAYHHGLDFICAEKLQLKTIAGINLQNMSMHKYVVSESFKLHCCTPDQEVLSLLETKKDFIIKMTDEFLNIRYSGKEQQHDTLRAYRQDKHNTSREELVDKYKLDPSKKIVFVMAHIFQDAPHALPGMYFRDYKNWLQVTCLELAKNHEVEFLVKEHPSIDIYNEYGVIEDVLDQIDCKHKVLDKDINTASLFGVADVIVTCGGTAGLEFACAGTPILLASKPPYACFGCVKTTSSCEEYVRELSNLHNYSKLSKGEQDMMKLILFAMTFINSPAQQLCEGKMDRLAVNVNSLEFSNLLHDFLYAKTCNLLNINMLNNIFGIGYDAFKPI